MDILILLALVAFIAAVVLGFVQKSWPAALIALGLLLYVLSGAGWITG